MKNTLKILFVLCLGMVYSQGILLLDQDSSIDALIVRKRAMNARNTQKDSIVVGSWTQTQKEEVICPPYPKDGMVNGYKAQLSKTKTKAEADKLKSEFSRKFPTVPATIRYESPNYKVYVGNYFSREDSDKAIYKIRKHYPGTFSVQTKVFVDKEDWNNAYCPDEDTTEKE